MTIRRRAAAIGAVTLGLFALAACENPSPITTVTAGSDSISFEASCYNEGEALGTNEQKKCQNAGSAKTIEVSPETEVRFGVDPKIAEQGWIIAINNQPAINKPIEKTYTYFTGQSFFQAAAQGGQGAKTATVSIIAQGEKPGTTSGVWNFKLKQTD
ncbi:DUF2771 domain-containing protein [Streptomyces sp. NPDC059506]|uniref:DUF2771 domain-containing protein n=1 Tax=Streptomyces sp. NPDC059506 TaxID=3347751 RepID=UPI0036B88EBA